MILKILTAGAGHGGLVAAAKLAKAGHEVIVYEKQRRDQLGHDWEDRFTFDLLQSAAELDELPEDIWRYRGDCAFISPDYETSVPIYYNESNRQKIMWRKPILELLCQYAESCGVQFCFETAVERPILQGDNVIGLQTTQGDCFGDLVIDAAGVFSPVRSQLPAECGIEKWPRRGDVFYAYRAYYNKTDGDALPPLPFEVYLRHAGEQGLSWCCTNSDSVDILIGRIDPLNRKKLQNHIENFRQIHPWIGEEILHGGTAAVIPVRRPLARMITNGYAAVGDSAFMTTPMNGMGIDLALQAGLLLAETILRHGNTDVQTLWEYNREFHIRYGGDTAKNEGLKNALLNLPQSGVDFLFAQQVIQASDLSGAGSNTSFNTLLSKFAHGMKQPPFFAVILDGLMKGAQTAKLYKSVPEQFDAAQIAQWQKNIQTHAIKVQRLP